ncbi:MAG: hypothetical protein Q7K48_07430 [Fusobacterium sp. JB021]|nr:hypothetical protein [Fusobacterium sp. JB021]
MKNVWKLNIKTEGINKHDQDGLLKLWKKEKIIGIKWDDPFFIIGIDENMQDAKEIKNYVWSSIKQTGKSAQGFTIATNIIIDKMDIGDYIWTISEGLYYIAKVLTETKYRLSDQDYTDHNLGFYRNVEYSKKFFHESEVPGKIVSGFTERNSSQHIADQNNKIFDYTEALFLGKEISKINLEDWTIFSSAKEIEELVCLYLQVKKNLYIYASTNKKSTTEIKFELVDKNGNLYGVQIKNKNESINGNAYQEISKTMKIFLFTTSDNVIIENNINLIHITVNDITNFIKNYKHLLPSRIKKWLFK